MEFIILVGLVHVGAIVAAKAGCEYLDKRFASKQPVHFKVIKSYKNGGV